MASLEGRTVFMSGGSRGIGLAIARRAARDGANVAIVAKTDQPHPKLEGTIHTAAEAIEADGGRCLPIVGDIRDPEQVTAAVERTAEHFGGIDICVNNASAINLMGVADLPVKRYDLMQSVNARGTFLCIQACAPHLRASDHAHILTLSPPLDPSPRWFGHSAYTVSKYGMTIITLGAAAELGGDGVAANCLWPRTIIATAAVQNLLGGDEAMARSRTPEIVADAAHAILTTPPADRTGRALIDDDVLAEAGVDDLSPYAAGDGSDLQLDLFVDGWP
jgi:citronellol/citronellal dehydrogenase